MHHLPGVAVCSVQLGVALHLLSESVFGIRFLLHDRRILQAANQTDVCLARILDAEELIVRTALVLRAAFAVRVQQHFAAAEHVERERIGHVA